MSNNESITVLKRLDLAPTNGKEGIIADEKEFAHLMETGQVDQLIDNPLFQGMDPVGKLDSFNQCVDNKLKQLDRIARVLDRVNNREVFLGINKLAVELNRKREEFNKKYMAQELGVGTDQGNVLEVDFKVGILVDTEEKKAA